MTERKRRVLGGAAGAMIGAILMIAGPALAQHEDVNRADGAVQAMGHGGNAAQVDAAHAELAKLTGEFDRVVKFVGQTGAAAAPSTGTSKFSVALDGRFILEESKDVVFGRPVEGLRIYGYNDATKQYEMARMYTMSNAITLMKGTSNDGGKTIDYAGETETTGTGKVAMHATLRWMSDDEFSVTMSTASADGKETPFQETIYTRKK